MKNFIYTKNKYYFNKIYDDRNIDIMICNKTYKAFKKL